MAVIKVSRAISAPVAAVWRELARIEDHCEWMADAVALRFDDDQHRGVGTRISVDTKVGLLKTVDRMEFIRWDPPQAMGVRHRGLVGGTGEFSLVANDDGSTTITWREDLEFPWYFGGPVGAWLARPVLARIWRGNLDGLADRL